MQPYIQQHSQTVESRTNFVKSLYVTLKQGKQTVDKDQIIIIQTYTVINHTSIQVVVRKVSQLDYLQHHLYNNYGGHIIPYIHCDLYFQQDSEPEQLVQSVSQYLNDLCTDYYCAGDEKVFDFLLNQEVFSPDQLTYDKILSKAAVYSRRYLNSIFARKQINEVSNPLAGQFVQMYKMFCTFSNNFKQFRNIALNYDQQEQLTQEIFSLISQISGSLSVATVPIEYLNTKTKNKINRIYKMVLQGEEAFKRWEMMNQTVRQLQGNVRKGLHQQHKALHAKQKQLQKWTKSLSSQYKQIIQSAEKVMQKIAGQFLQKRKQQFRSLYQVLKHKIYIQQQISKKLSSQSKQQKIEQKQQIQIQNVHQKQENEQKQKVQQSQKGQKGQNEVKIYTEKDLSIDKNEEQQQTTDEKHPEEAQTDHQNIIEHSTTKESQTKQQQCINA